jgi:hypothetical protein
MRTPAYLQAQGKALWKKITGEFDLENEPDRLELLFQARRPIRSPNWTRQPPRPR